MSQFILDKFNERFKSVKKLEKTLNVKFKDKEYAIQALTTPSFVNEYPEQLDRVYHNDALATLGDAVLKTTISENIFRRERGIDEGTLTTRKSMIENNENLRRIAIELNIENLLIKTEKEIIGEDTLPTAMEAIIGAIYLSNGIKSVKKFVQDMIIDKTDIN
jgi:ribonuclease-3